MPVALPNDSVSGVKPEIAPGLDRLVRHIEIACRERIRFDRTQEKLAGLTIRHRRFIQIDDASLGPRHQVAHGSWMIGWYGARKNEVCFRRGISVDERN